MDEVKCECARAPMGSTRCDSCGHDLGCPVHKRCAEGTPDNTPSELPEVRHLALALQEAAGPLELSRDWFMRLARAARAHWQQNRDAATAELAQVKEAIRAFVADHSSEGLLGTETLLVGHHLTWNRLRDCVRNVEQAPAAASGVAAGEVSDDQLFKIGTQARYSLDASDSTESAGNRAERRALYDAGYKAGSEWMLQRIDTGNRLNDELAEKLEASQAEVAELKREVEDNRGRISLFEEDNVFLADGLIARSNGMLSAPSDHTEGAMSTVRVALDMIDTLRQELEAEKAAHEAAQARCAEYIDDNARLTAELGSAQKALAVPSREQIASAFLQGWRGVAFPGNFSKHDQEMLLHGAEYALQLFASPPASPGKRPVPDAGVPRADIDGRMHALEDSVDRLFAEIKRLDLQGRGAREADLLAMVKREIAAHTLHDLAGRVWELELQARVTQRWIDQNLVVGAAESRARIEREERGEKEPTT
jgi:hypothetical protein